MLRWIYLLVSIVGLAWVPVHADASKGSNVNTTVLYVANDGKDSASGKREDPLLTLAEAEKRLRNSGGHIVLREGIYSESVTLLESSSPNTLVIRAELGEHVVFDGGERVTGWEKWPRHNNLYVAAISNAEDYTLYVWDRNLRYRYLRHLDEEGVRAWPGSFCLLRDGRILVHAIDGKPPIDLQRSRDHFAIHVLRSQVSIQGIHFQNYFYNAYTAAVVVGASAGNITRNVEIADCRMDNVARGVRIGSATEDTRIIRCHIRDAETGINNTGNYLRIEDCIIENAVGDFQLHGVNSPMSCAIRLYSPGRGAKVTGCVTAGFNHGLRIKTGENGLRNKDLKRGAFTIEHNTFLDGISITEGSLSATDRYTCNVIGNTGAGVLNFLRAKSVVVDNNYWIRGNDQQEVLELGEGNLSGPGPYVDLAGGDLGFRHGIQLPECADGMSVGARYKQVTWSKEIATWIIGESVNTEHGNNSVNSESKLSKLMVDHATLRPPRTFYVAEGADHSVADGSKEFPFPQLQQALDAVNAGDTVSIAEGIYTQPAVLERSGTEQAPILIEGAGEGLTLLDGGRKWGVMLELRGIHHVVVRGIQVRWFEEAGIAIKNSSHVRVEQCRFINAELTSGGSAVGAGVLLERSPNCVIAHSTVTRTRFGFRILRSPGVVLQNNTAFKNLNTGAELNRSCRGSVIVGNSFTFSGHSPIYMWEPDKDALLSMVMDFNNYANRLYDYRSNGQIVHPVVPPERYGRVSGGKGVLELLLVERDTGSGRTRFHDLEDWKQYAGKDTHSIFADPLYADPLNGDFRVLLGSPNILNDGKVIGAWGVVGH